VSGIWTASFVAAHEIPQFRCCGIPSVDESWRAEFPRAAEHNSLQREASRLFRSKTPEQLDPMDFNQFSRTWFGESRSRVTDFANSIHNGTTQVVRFQNSLHERFFPQAVKPCAGTSGFMKHTLIRTPGATPWPRSVRFQRWVVRKRTGFQVCSPVDIQQNQYVLLDVYMAENVLTPYAGRTFLRARRSTSLGRRRAYEETLAGTLSCDCSL